MNLLKETIDILQNHGKTMDDVLWFGSRNFTISREEFEQKADYDYDKGYGAPEVAQDLLVVGKDFWLERHEYDGSEWWEYKSMPIKPTKKAKARNVVLSGQMWEDLEELKG